MQSSQRKQKKYLTKFDHNKILIKLRIEWNSLNLRKGVFEKFRANIILNCEKLNGFALEQKQGKDKTLTTFIHYYTGGLSSIRRERSEGNAQSL